MKKSKWLNAGNFIFRSPEEIVLKMKLTSLLIFAGIIQAIALNGYSQSTKLTMEFRNISVVDALRAIEDQSEYYFVYNKDAIDLERKVNLNAKDLSVEEILKNIFKETNVSYRMVDRHIILSTLQTEQFTLKVTGKVTDSSGIPLPGVTVVVKGTSNGIITNVDGSYLLSNVPSDAILLFSFVGMRSQEIKIEGKTTVNVTLEEETIGIEEVVAIGYGVARKKDLTGAVASVRLEDSPREVLPNVNVLDALKGQMPGFDVGASTNAGGNPSINIRGQNSIKASNTPLVVVDGVVYVGSFNELNPSDIASVDVLKDASSAAVYGSRAANGVILVTTKRGKTSKPTVRLRATGGIQTYTNRPDMLDPEGYIQIKKDVKSLNGGSAADLELQNLLTIYEYNAYNAGNIIDWFDEVTRIAPIQDYQLSISGNGERLNYYVSGQLLDQEGIVYGDQFEKYSVNSKIESTITDWLKLTVNLSAISKNADGVAADLRNATINAPYSWKYVQTPGFENVMERYPQGQTTTQNPFWRTQQYNEDRNQNYRSLFSARVDAPWVKGLSYTFNYSLNRWEGHSANFYNERYYMDTMKEADLKDQTKFLKDANGNVSNSYRTDWFLNHLINFNRVIKDHSIGVTLLAERQKQLTRSSTVTAKDFSLAGTTVLGVNALEKGKVENRGVDTGYSQLTQLAYMARVNYVFKQRYHLSSSIRYDGYSGFAEGNKYGSFFSAAGAWTMSEENFAKDNLPFLNYLKIRASYGENGNPSIGQYSTFPSIASSSYIFGNSTVSTTSASKLANKALKWEKTGALNFGADFSIFRDLFSGNIEYYNSNTTNLLFDRAIPIMNGFSNVSDNIGKVNNWGIEIQLNSKNIKTPDFTWSSGINFWMNRNKVVSLYGLDGNNDGVEDDDISSNIFIGKSLGAIYTYTFDGIIQMDDAEYMAIYGGNPGDVRFKDINRDGKITAAGDRSIVGYSKPNFTMTLSNTLTYRNMELYFLFNWIAGSGENGYYSGDNLYANNPSTLYGGGVANWLDKEYWMPDHPSNKIPRPNWTNSLGYQFPSRRDFVRLQDVSFSYIFPKHILGGTPVENMKVFLAAKNLLTFSKWDGYDPETGSQHAADTFPVMKSVIVGVDISF